MELAELFFSGRASFFNQILTHIDEPSLIDAIKADGVDINVMWTDWNELYETLNRGGSKTRELAYIKI